MRMYSGKAISEVRCLTYISLLKDLQNKLKTCCLRRSKDRRIIDLRNLCLLFLCWFIFFAGTAVFPASCCNFVAPIIFFFKIKENCNKTSFKMLTCDSRKTITLSNFCFSESTHEFDKSVLFIITPFLWTINAFEWGHIVGTPFFSWVGTPLFKMIHPWNANWFYLDR